MSDTLKKIELPSNLTVRELAERIEASPIQVIKTLMNNGVMASINQLIDFDSAAIVAEELGFEAVPEATEEDEHAESGEIPLWRQLISGEDPKDLRPRPPVVTILGHVDHGKTSLLDAIRQTNVAAKEAGGITQHISAYQVTHNGKLITFLDTPGHAAFTAMRARGAQGADIVVLVVAADDGVMPQTKEAISHAKAARVPIVVALNKMDKANANPDRVKQQLAENELVPDDWGGDIMVVPVSAKNQEGIEDLLEAIVLTAESMQIEANPKGKVIGTVIEARMDKSRGVMATLLVQNGTLKKGDIVVVDTAYGRIKALYDFYGKQIKEAGPSTPVGAIGLNAVPSAGELFRVVRSDKEARTIVNRRMDEKKAKKRQRKVTLEELFSQVQAGEIRELRLIIKADVQGSLDPIISEVNKLAEGQTDIKIKVLHAEAGNISENDIMLASASQAIVIGFNVQADVAARRLAEAEGVSIRLYDIIYRLTEDLEKSLKGMLKPEMEEKPLGRAEVLAVFNISKYGRIAGCRVREGVVRRNAKARLWRGEDLVYEGEIDSLKREKENAKEVREGFECGIHLKNFNDTQVGDIIECFYMGETEDEE